MNKDYKITYVISMFGLGIGKYGSSHNIINGCCAFTNSERKYGFSLIREYIRNDYIDFIKNKTACADDIIYYCNIVIINDKHNTKKAKFFNINPRNII